MIDFENMLRSKKNRWIFSLTSSVLLSLSWYPPFTYLIFIALIPLLALEEYYYVNKSEKSCKTYLKYIYFSLLGWNIGAIWWLWNATEWLTVGVFTLHSFLMLLPFLLYHKARIWSNNSLVGFFWIGCYVSFEYLDLNWALTFSWIHLGHAFGTIPYAVQWYSFTGILGGSAWVLLLNYLFFISFRSRADVWKKFAFYAFVGIIIPVLGSLYVYLNYEDPKDTKKATIVVVQPNFDCYDEKFEYNAKTGEKSSKYVPFSDQISRFLDISSKHVTKETDFLLFPETSFHINMQEDVIEQYEPITRLREWMKAFPQLAVFTGMDTYVFYPNSEIPPSSTSRKTSSGYWFDKYNTGAFIENDENVSFYHKSKLVVGAEANPIQPLFPFELPVFFRELAGGLGTQEERTVFTNKNGITLAPVICYESVYGDFLTEYFRKKAQFIGLITNDGWWGNTSGHVQHLRFSQLRAIESGRWVARSANTGISCFIQPNGVITQSLGYGKQGALTATIPLIDTNTFYATYGDILGRIAAGFILILISGLFIKNILNR